MHGEVLERFFKNLLSSVILRLYTKCQCPIVPGTARKVCGAVVWSGGMMVCKPNLVFSLAQAEQKLK